MNIKNYNQIFQGSAGNIEAMVDCPDNYDRLAIVCHPNPLFGGTNQNKVTATIARTLNQHGFCTIRPNFRGVKNSQGTHDQGVGEAQDMLLLIEQAVLDYPTKWPVTLAGFSFGAFVMTHVINRLQQQNYPIDFMILAGVACGLFDCAEISGEPLIIHGEKDDIILMDSVFRWAEPQEHPTCVIAGAEHFFSGKLHVVKKVISKIINKKT